MNLTAVIMAGGRGERFWPRSRRNMPKQFLDLTGDRTMLQMTVDRIRPLVPAERVFVATGREYAGLVLDQLPDLSSANLILEPEGRDTAPCIGLAALCVEKVDPGAVMLVLPADHLIEKEAEFRDLLLAAARVANAGDALVTLGISPTSPETGYGYIQCGKQSRQVDGRPVYKVERFTEKPDFETARRFLADGEYLWNSGMFIWKASAIRSAVGRYLPDLHAGLEEIRPAIGNPEEEEVLAAVFPRLRKVSIDYGVMERAEEVYVLRADIGWNDVGAWTALERFHETDERGNLLRGEGVLIDTVACTIDAPGKLVAAVGLEDLVIVDTPDALLVCRKDKVHEIKLVIAKLKEQGKSEYL